MKTSSGSARICAAAPAALALGAIVAACGQSPLTLGGTTGQPGPVYGPTGSTVAVQIAAGSDGSNLSVTLAAEPSAIVVTPTTVTTDDNGSATAFALVPYGTNGVVVASAIDATAGSIPVSCPPIALCNLQAKPATGAADLGPAGQVYTVSASAFASGGCAGTAAPAGIGVTFAVLQPSGTMTTTTMGSGASVSNTISSATVPTDAGGNATASVLVPWGANVVVQAAGGGAVAETSLAGVEIPVSIDCLSWTEQQAGLYELAVSVVARLGGSTVVPMPATPISLYPVYTSGGTGMVTATPPSALTDASGVATAFVAVPSTVTLPVVVEAVAGSSAQAVTIDGGKSGHAGLHCP